MLPRLACIAIAVLALAACGGSSSNTLARVGDQKVTTKQVNALVDEVINELRQEGKAVPAHGSKGEKALERQALAILVGRARLEQKAADLGVKVSDEDVLKRVAPGRRPGASRRAARISSPTRRGRSSSTSSSSSG
jgi:parvulin-like peptidyl-prolyl isomerase